jgi:hypothetical protein
MLIPHHRENRVTRRIGQMGFVTPLLVGQPLLHLRGPSTALELWARYPSGFGSIAILRTRPGFISTVLSSLRLNSTP